MAQTPGVDAFGHLPVRVDARVGSRNLTVAELLQLEIGSVVTLDRPAGETLQLRVGNVLLASAEIVTIEDRLAVRITDFDFRATDLSGIGGGASRCRT